MPSAEGGAEGSEREKQPAELDPERTSAFMQAMFDRLEEHARSTSLQLRKELLAAQDEFMSRMAAERILEFMQDLEDYFVAENVLTSGRRIALLFQGIQSRVDLDELKIAIETQERLEGKKLK